MSTDKHSEKRKRGRGRPADEVTQHTPPRKAKPSKGTGATATELRQLPTRADQAIDPDLTDYAGLH